MDLILILFIVIISSIAYIYVRYNFNTYKKVVSKSDLSGFEVARKILDIHDMNDVYITAVSGRYSDHYNSSRKVIKLSKKVFNDSNITSLSIAAFEAAEAILDKKNDSMFKFREMFVELFKYISYFGYIAILVGIFFAVPPLFTIGIACEALSLLFSMATIKVEIKAARLALDELLEISAINKEENEKVKSVLAACCYKNTGCLINNIVEVFGLIYNFGVNR